VYAALHILSWAYAIHKFYLALSDFFIAVTPLHYTAYNAGSQWGAAIGSISA